MTIRTLYQIIKTIVFCLILVAIGAIAYKGMEYFKNYKAFESGSLLAFQEKLDEQNRKYLQITENIVRSNIEIVSKLDKDREIQNDQLKKLIIDNKETIKSIGEIQSKWNENVSRQLQVASDHSYKENTGDYNEQYFKKITVAATGDDGEKKEVPIGWAIYFPNREPEKQWKTGVYPIEYHSKIISAEQSTGQSNVYAEVWMENNKDSESKGIKFPIKIESSEFKEVKIKDKGFNFFNPKLDLGIGIASSSNFNTEPTAGLGLSLMSYGKTENDMDWRFLRFGVSMTAMAENKDYLITFSPLSYNLAKFIPVMTNLWLSPELNINASMGFGFGVSIGLLF